MNSPDRCVVADVPRLRLFGCFSSHALPAVLGLLLAGASLCPRLSAASITLTQAMLDDYHLGGGIVDFSQSTIGYGTNAVANTLQPGDTVYIQAHTRKFLRLKNLTQGTAASPITITNTGGQFIIQAASPTDYDSQGLGLWGCQHVVLKGTPSPGNYDYGIKIASTKDGATGIKISDNGNTSNLIGSLDVEIHDVEIGNTGFAGIQAKCESAMPSGYVMSDLRIHDNYIHDTAGEGLYIGWTSSGHHWLSNVDIHHNTLRNVGWDGIQVNYVQSNGLVHDNTLIGYGARSDESGSVGDPNYWQNKGITVGASEIKIYNNWVEATENLAGNPMFLYTYKNTSIYNNVFIFTGSSGDPNPESGVYVADISSLPPVSGTVINILNNTIITPEGAGIDDRSTGATTNFTNNIVAAPGHSQPYVIRYSSGVVLNETTNLYVSTVAGGGFTNASAGDYSLASGSAAVDAGTSTSSAGVTTDYLGTTRPQGSAYDIGAYERVASTIVVGIITPSAWGTASGGNYCPATGAFNAQPTWDSVNARPTGDDPSPNSDTSTAYANRYWYIDFGADYAKVRITAMWTRYRPYSGGSYSGFPSMWWDDDNDTVNDGTAATGLQFASAQNLPEVGSQQWVRDVDFSSAPVTPQGRYLVIGTGANPTNRANEFVFIGYRVN